MPKRRLRGCGALVSLQPGDDLDRFVTLISEDGFGEELMQIGLRCRHVMLLSEGGFQSADPFVVF